MCTLKVTVYVGGGAEQAVVAKGNGQFEVWVEEELSEQSFPP